MRLCKLEQEYKKKIVDDCAGELLETCKTPTGYMLWQQHSLLRTAQRCVQGRDPVAPTSSGSHALPAALGPQGPMLVSLISDGGAQRRGVAPVVPGVRGRRPRLPKGGMIEWCHLQAGGIGIRSSSFSEARLSLCHSYTHWQSTAL